MLALALVKSVDVDAKHCWLASCLADIDMVTCVCVWCVCSRCGLDVMSTSTAVGRSLDWKTFDCMYSDTDKSDLWLGLH